MAQWVVTLLCNHKNWSLYPQDTHKKLVVFMQCVCNLGLETLRQETHSQGSPVKMVWLKLMSSASVKNYTSKKKNGDSLPHQILTYTGMHMDGLAYPCRYANSACIYMYHTQHILKKKRKKGWSERTRHQDVLK